MISLVSPQSISQRTAKEPYSSWLFCEERPATYKAVYASRITPQKYEWSAAAAAIQMHSVGLTLRSSPQTRFHLWTATEQAHVVCPHATAAAIQIVVIHNAYKRELQKRPTKETYKRDLQKRPTKENPSHRAAAAIQMESLTSSQEKYKINCTSGGTESWDYF